MTMWLQSGLCPQIREFRHDVVLTFLRRVWSPILSFATSLRVRERIDRERAAEFFHLGLGGFPVENPVGATSWNQPSIQRLRNAPFVFEDFSHLFMFGVKDLRSRRAPRVPSGSCQTVESC